MEITKKKKTLKPLYPKTWNSTPKSNKFLYNPPCNELQRNEVNERNQYLKKKIPRKKNVLLFI